ncbi:MAG: metal ABC transporter permease [bacterium]
MEIFQYEFIQNALLSGLFASIACGIIGSIVVSKRIVSICGGIAHASFGGIGLGYLLKINPSFGAVIFGILSSLGIGIISKKGNQTEDTSIAIFWSAGMSLGIIFISLSKGYAPDLFTYLFGNILAVNRFDLMLICVLDILLGIVIICFYKEILAVCFDEEFLQVRGLPVFTMYLMLLFLVSITVVILMKIIGIILVIALFSLPAAIARKFTRTLKSMIGLSIVLCMIFITSGLVISYIFNLPSGAVIIIISTIVFLMLDLFKKFIALIPGR